MAKTNTMPSVPFACRHPLPIMPDPPPIIEPPMAEKDAGSVLSLRVVDREIGETIINYVPEPKHRRDSGSTTRGPSLPRGVLPDS